jgi:hypothetical protein
MVFRSGDLVFKFSHPATVISVRVEIELFPGDVADIVAEP